MKYIITFRKDGWEYQCSIKAKSLKDATTNLVRNTPGDIQIGTCREVEDHEN